MRISFANYIDIKSEDDTKNPNVKTSETLLNDEKERNSIL